MDYSSVSMVDLEHVFARYEKCWDDKSQKL